jgi:RES domain-containing protein
MSQSSGASIATSGYHGTSAATAPRTPADLPAYLDHAMAHTREDGGRFNPPGEFGAVYLALDVETAQRESEAAELVLEVDLSLSKVVDLTNPNEAAKWGLTADSVCGADHEPCRAAGRRIREAGYEAVKYPSAITEGTNLAIFWDRRADTSSLRLAGRVEI